MAMQIFGNKTVFAGVLDEPSTHGHTFGGKPELEGLLPQGSDTPVHVICMLNLHDPRVGITIPEVQ